MDYKQDIKEFLLMLFVGLPVLTALVSVAVAVGYWCFELLGFLINLLTGGSLS